MSSLPSENVDINGGEFPTIYECHEKDFYRIREKLSVIKDLNINDKLGYDENDVLYIDKYQWGQYFRRVWYGQSRQKTEKYLNRVFTEFMQYLDNYLKFLDNTPHFIVKTLDKRYKTLTGEICQFINDIIVGLYNLKKTYPEFKELKCRVDSIIMTMVDFKDKVKKSEDLIRVENIIHERALSF